MAFTIKQNDTAPAYVADLQDSSGGTPAAIDLTDATSVTFKMRAKGNTTTLKVDSPMTVDADPTSGRVTYEWQAGDTDTTGDFDVEFEIAWSDGTVETVPNADYLVVTVVDDLDV